MNKVWSDRHSRVCHSFVNIGSPQLEISENIICTSSSPSPNFIYLRLLLQKPRVNSQNSILQASAHSKETGRV